VGALGLWRNRRSKLTQLLLIAGMYTTAISLVSVAVPRLRAPLDLTFAVGAALCIAPPRHRAASRTATPERRAARVVPSAIALIVMVAAVALAPGVLREGAGDRATSAVSDALARYGSAPRMLLAAYPLDPTGPPPDLDASALDALREMLKVIGPRAATVPDDLRAPIDRVVRSLLVTAHELDVVSLLSAAEAIGADERGQRASIKNVQRRYEQEVASEDATLAEWPDVVDGKALHELQDALTTLERSLEAYDG